MEDNIQNECRIVRVACYAIWINKFLDKIHEMDE
jgi:hypothetical protein